MEFLSFIFTEFYTKLFKLHPVLTGIFTVIFGSLFYLKRSDKNLIFSKFVAIDHYIIKEQMHIAEEKMDLLEDSIIKLFLKMKTEIQGNNKGLMYNEDVKRFQLLIKYLKKKILKQLRHSFRENHLAERDNYELWTDCKTEEILRPIKELFNVWYCSSAEPTAEDFYDRYSLVLRPIIKEGIKAIFRKAKTVSLNFKDKEYVKKYIKMTNRKIRG